MADSHNRTFYPYVEVAEICDLAPTKLLRHALAGKLKLVREQVKGPGRRTLWKLGDDPAGSVLRRPASMDTRKGVSREVDGEGP